MAGGFPIGAILANQSVASAFSPGDHGSTFGGNPLAASAALACVGKIKEELFLHSVQSKGELLKNALTDLQTRDLGVKAIRGLGLMLGLELEAPVKPIIKECAERGLLLVGAGDNVIRFLPPLTVSRDEIINAVEILEAVLKCRGRPDRIEIRLQICNNATQISSVFSVTVIAHCVDTIFPSV